MASQEGSALVQKTARRHRHTAGQAPEPRTRDCHHTRVGIDAPDAGGRRALEARSRKRTSADAEIDDGSHRARRMIEGASDFRNQLVVERDQRADASVIFRRRDGEVGGD
jgi:hypothetical protein